MGADQGGGRMGADQGAAGWERTRGRPAWPEGADQGRPAWVRVGYREFGHCYLWAGGGRGRGHETIPWGNIRGKRRHDAEETADARDTTA
jgi:hypothetical protein